MGKPFRPPACWNCGKPIGVERPRCPVCRMCNRCGCTCQQCGECGSKHSPDNHRCHECGRCRTACSRDGCRKRPGALRTKPVVGPTLVNTMPRAMGLEIELAEWNGLDQWRPGNFSFRVVHDGSVRPSGNEMVTSPIGGDKFMASVFELGAKLVEHGSTVNDTCGLHVHVNASDLSYWDIRRLLLMYRVLEGEIYQYLVSPVRAGNRYCRMFDTERKSLMDLGLPGLKTTGDIKKWLYQFLYKVKPLGDAPKEIKNDQLRNMAAASATEFGAGTLMGIKRDKYGGGHTAASREARYFGLNLHSWLHRGTVEFRMHEGTVEVQELLCWPLWCGWLVELATKLTDRDVAKLQSLLDFTQAHMPKFVGTWALNKIRHTNMEEVA